MGELSNRVLRAQTLPRRADLPDPERGRELCTPEAAATAAIVVAALRSALRLKGEGLRPQRFVVRGAGPRGLATARLLRRALADAGLTPGECAQRVFVVGDRGLVVDETTTSSSHGLGTPRSSTLTWSRGPDGDGAPSLLDTVREVGATALVGLSNEHGAFSTRVLTALGTHCAVPVVVHGTVDAKRAEATFEGIVGALAGQVIVATPIGDDGPGCDDAWTYPGIILGLSISGAAEPDEDIALAASSAVVRFVAERAPERLLPTRDDAADVTRAVAIEVARAALRNGAATNPALRYSGLEATVDRWLREPVAAATPMRRPR
ncbi:MAG: hypothetical protein H6698_02985 [Myxococcales bacterium]|nr:hypothetical protein [Myxococcales bacterium]MCB9519495.1 hypothetical protein [Myxococcales bacterium]MCB9532095.1 hypothetical protein [Myxococcales bacterium]MCB9533280.1 hypothetical protein [Myxococcales bacterium]